MEEGQTHSNFSTKESEDLKKLIYTTIICVLFIIAEIIGGIIANSLAIISDAAHLFSDLSGFFISIIAMIIGKKAASAEYTFGYYRAEVVGALISVVSIWIITIFLLREAYERLKNPSKINSVVMLVTAIIGLICNLSMMKVLHSSPHSNHECSHGHSHPAPLQKNKKENESDSNSGDNMLDINEKDDIEARIGKENKSKEIKTSNSNHKKIHNAHCKKGKKSHCGDHKTSKPEKKITCPKNHKKQEEIIELDVISEDLNKNPINEKDHYHDHCDCSENSSKKENLRSLDNNKKDKSSILTTSDSSIELNENKEKSKKYSKITHKLKCDDDHNHDHNHENDHCHEHGHDKDLNNCDSNKNQQYNKCSHEDEHHHDHSHEDNINVQAAIIHIIGDIIQSIGVVIASFIIYFKPEWSCIDPICTLIFSIIVLFTTKNITKKCINILMEASPTNIDVEEIKQKLKENFDDIISIHLERLWVLSSNRNCFSSHIVLDENSENRINILKFVKKKFYVKEINIQFETPQEFTMLKCLKN